MKKVISVILFLVLSYTFYLVLNNNDIIGTENKTKVDIEVQDILTSFYNNGVYTKNTIINLVDPSKEEISKMFHASCNNLERITHYDGEELWMTNTEGTINSGYTTINGDMLHFKKIDGVNVYDYTVKNTVVTEYYSTLKTLKNTCGWVEESEFIYINTDSIVIDEFRQFIAPLWLNTEVASNYIVLTGVRMFEESGVLHLQLLTSCTDNAKITNNDGVFAEATINGEVYIYSRNDKQYVKFGSYPQSHVGDKIVIEKLEQLYVQNSDNVVEYGLKKYVKIKTSTYYDGYPYKYSDGKYIYNNKEEWFVVEPIIWNIVSEKNGQYILISNKILDAKIYNENVTRTIDGETIYPNNYKYSYIRNFLNNEFFNLAFSVEEKKHIILSEVINDSTSTNEFGAVNNSLEYICENTFDWVYLPSVFEMCNYEVFNTTEDASTNAGLTDFSQGRGVKWTLTYGNWWWRTPHWSTRYSQAYAAGYKDVYTAQVDFDFYGVRPMICIQILQQ